MAKFQFYVAREGQPAMACIAHIPSQDDLLTWDGGKVRVETPKGEQTVDVPAPIDLLIGQLTVKLQNGVRDFLFPPDPKSGKVSAKRRATGFLQE